MNKDLAILVISCDKYSDAWKPFFALFHKFWYDCHYPIYLGTNKKSFSDAKVKVLFTGEDSSWSDSVRRMLEQIPESYVLMFFEDFFIASQIENSLIDTIFHLMVRDNISFIKIFPAMKSSEKYCGNDDIYRVKPEDDYCINTGLSMWGKETLMQLLKPGYSAWDFEIKNSTDCRHEKHMPGVFLSLKNSKVHIKNGIWRSKWVPSSIRFCRHLGIEVDTTQRDFMNINEVFWEKAKMIGKIVLPNSLERIIKRVLICLGFGNRFVTTR